MIARRLWGLVEHAAEALLVFLVATMTATCLLQVVLRYVFNDPVTWSEELARYAFVWIGYLSAWLAWKHRAHIAVDAVTYVNSPALQWISARLVEALILAFCTYTFYTNMRLLSISDLQPSAVLEVPMSWVYAGYSAMAALIIGDILVSWFLRAPPAPRPVAEV